MVEDLKDFLDWITNFGGSAQAVAANGHQLVPMLALPAPTAEPEVHPCDDGKKPPDVGPDAENKDQATMAASTNDLPSNPVTASTGNTENPVGNTSSNLTPTQTPTQVVPADDVASLKDIGAPENKPVHVQHEGMDTSAVEKEVGRTQPSMLPNRNPMQMHVSIMRLPCRQMRLLRPRRLLLLPKKQLLRSKPRRPKLRLAPKKRRRTRRMKRSCQRKRVRYAQGDVSKGWGMGPIRWDGN